MVQKPIMRFCSDYDKSWHDASYIEGIAMLSDEWGKCKVLLQEQVQAAKQRAKDHPGAGEMSRILLRLINAHQDGWELAILFHPDERTFYFVDPNHDYIQHFEDPEIYELLAYRHLWFQDDDNPENLQ